MTQQLESAKMQAKSKKAALEQEDDLKKVYDGVYDKVVTQPANQLVPKLSQVAVQAGDFLE
ncbi:hypothetical protein EIO60_04032|nr:hypothetical protein [Candidatus Pantoea persica]